MFNGLRNIFSRKAPPNELSELFEGELEITIEGIGTQKMMFDCEPLVGHIATIQAILTMHVVFVSDVSCPPWKIVSFDREAKKLVVRPVK